jgi:hypothetical protein
MTVSVRPRTKLLATLLAACVVAATPAVTTSRPEVLPEFSSVAVQPTSFVTDILYDLGDVGNATTNGALIAADLVLGMNFYIDNTDFGSGVPFNPAFAALIALQQPDQIGSLLSYVVQLYSNPAESFTALSTYPWYFKSFVLEQYANVLPAPLSQAVVDAINGVAEGINNVLKALPDPAAARNSMADLYSTDLGNAVYAAQAAIQAPVQIVGDFAYWASYVPGDVEASFESALRDPSEIPGLLSYLAYTVLDPDLGDGLLGNIAASIDRPLLYLPGPIGGPAGLAANAYNSFVDGVNYLLASVLPTPVTPTPFASTFAAAAPAVASKAVEQQQVSDSKPQAIAGAKSTSAPSANTGADDVKAAGHLDKVKAKASKAKAAGATSKGHAKAHAAG